MLNAVYAQDDNMVFRRIGDEVVLVPIRWETADMEAIYTLNETGAAIWELLDGQRTLAQVRDALVAEYDVSIDKAEQDVVEFIQTMEDLQGVRRAR